MLTTLLTAVLLCVLTGAATQAQTNPTAQQLPFSLTSQTGGALPAGVAAHRFGSIQTTRTTAPGSADIIYVTTSSSGGWRDEGTSGISLLASGTQPAGALVVAIDTTGKSNIKVSWVARTILQQASRDNSIALQYRVGTSGNFTDVDPSVYTSAGKTVPDSAAFTNLTLPAAAENQPVVQVRWVYWESAGSAGSRDRIAVDDISITADGGVTPTNPSGTGSASPSSVAPTATTLLRVTVTPGQNPTSLAHTVSANLSTIGGSATQIFFNDGTNGDVTAGDNVYSFNATVALGTSGGSKSLPVTIAETNPQTRTGTATISLTVLASTNPSATASASPASVLPGESSVLTVNVTPGTNPASTNLSVTADLSAIGGSATQALSNGGVGNAYTFTATVDAATAPGAKTLPVTIADAQNRTGSATINLNVEQPPPPADHVVISQVYGGGGNAASQSTPAAVYTNDYVELHNPTTETVNLTGWSIQYGSATGTTWTNKQPIGGFIGPGQYYLIQLGSGGSTGVELPELPNIVGDINISATNGKVALVSNAESLTGGGCPVGADADIVDFVGYGTANCREGGANAPAPSNANSIYRKGSGATDTNQNGADFFVSTTPVPRRTAPVVELGPWVSSTEPNTNGLNTPRDGTVTVSFSEAVEVSGAWYDINCTVSGPHNDATVAHTSDFKSYAVTPNQNFQFGEQCTVTVDRNLVHDRDTDDATPDTDLLLAGHSWTFTVVAAGQPAPYTPDVHLTMGNPTAATPDLGHPENYLMEKPTYSLSYNRDKGTPNWVSWHLDTSWFGSLVRADTFRPDPAVPSDWYRVQATDYFTSGFDRGHMTPNADRDHQDRRPINQETYLMTNMIPQAPDNNQGPWANLENHLRSLLTVNGQEYEAYIVAGPQGVGGAGSSGFATTIAGGHVTVPSKTWKVALIIPKGDGDVSRVTPAAKTIAVIMPNTQGIRTEGNPNDWQAYLTTVDAVEALTGYEFFSNLPDAVENSIEAGTNGVNPPGTENQSATTTEDNPVGVTLTAVSPDSSANFTYTVGQPAHGTLTGTGANRTYTPAPDFHGTDTFTFTANDGHAVSNTSTVTVVVTEVNDAPAAAADVMSAQEDTPLTFAAGDLTANDSAGAADETGQQLTVSAVSAGPDTHGTVALVAGQVTYTPDANYNGPASFTYQVCDDGKTFGATDSKCASASVNVTVASVNDAPSLSGVPTSAAVNELVAYSFTAAASDVDGQTLTFSLVGAPDGATINPSTGQFTWTPTEAQGGTGSPYGFTVRVSDGVADVDANVTVTVGEVNQAPTLAHVGDQTIYLGNTLSFVAAGSDADLPAQPLAYSLTGAVPSGASINPSTGQFAWTPTAAQVGQVYTFTVRVTDDGDGSLYAEEVIRVGVGYTWSGVLQPVNADGSSVFNLGRTVPVKFRLTGASAGLVNAQVRLYVAKVSNGVVGTEVEADSTSAASAGDLFRYDAASDQYVFNLGTASLTMGTYQLRFDAGDGVPRTVNIGLK